MAAVTALVQEVSALEGAHWVRGLPALLGSAGAADGALAALEAAELPAAAQAVADNAAAVVAAIRARLPALRITMDPVEFRGLRYHTGVAFTIYGTGTAGELARGGRYLSLNDEPATGMTLYPAAVMEVAPLRAPPPRIFVANGADPALLRALRAQGFVTIAALTPEDTPERLRCTHRLEGTRPVALQGKV